MPVLSPFILSAVADAALNGVFASPWKLLLAMLLSAGWIWLAPKVNEDAMYVHLPRQSWSGAYLGAGVLGLILWFVIPIYAVGLLMFVVFVGGSLAAYVMIRNGKVDPEDRIGTAEWFANITGANRRKVEAVQTHLRLYGADGKAVILSETDVQDSKIVHGYNLAQNFLYDLARIRAAEADVVAQGGVSQIRAIVDGVLQHRPTLSGEDAKALIRYIQTKAGLDVNERRRPQKGKISVDLANSPVDMEILTAGTNTSQRMQIRVMQELIQTNLDLLGMDASLVEQLLAATNVGRGMLIISGPGKSGVTSTLYSLLRRQDAYMKMLVKVEAHSAMALENITQYEYEDPARLPEMLATIMRRDPDVILLDQCPDAKTAGLLCDFSREKVVILGAKAKDSFTALARWVMTVGDPGRAVKRLHGVTCQTLIRKICPTCREPYQPDANLLKKINLTSDRVDVFYRPPTQKVTDNKGNVIPCGTCQDSGYYGRTGVFEYLRLTRDLRELVKNQAPLTQLKSVARRNKMQYLQENALGKVVAGITSIQEVVRTFQGAKK
ncbi:MAG: Flp pilus assembly complex ATPase component TadA [Phycisphaerae bacterium]|nr:Flp pilus assembly complex ATPase component TadA [Phycisphaerae bacterium]